MQRVLPANGQYRIIDTEEIITPALLIYPAAVEENIKATIALAGGDVNRWRPHIKTAKIPAALHLIANHGVKNLKCSTTLELLTACQAGFADVLLAFAVMGANAQRVCQIAESFPGTRISVLIENAAQAEGWRGRNVGLFLDINPGMNRTGVRQDGAGHVLELAQLMGDQFRGLHYYDGQMSGVAALDREASAHDGYRQLIGLVGELSRNGVEVGEVITSGTPAAPYGISFSGFNDRSFIHRISPGTVVYNDLSSLSQLPGYGYQAAAFVLATVISRPTESTITCDAGHKSVSVDSGVPNCSVLGYEHLKPLKPSEEHLPMESPTAEALPRVGEKIYLLPRHVCPTVNNFDDALFIRNGHVESVERVAARGHERPLQPA